MHETKKYAGENTLVCRPRSRILAQNNVTEKITNKMITRCDFAQYNTTYSSLFNIFHTQTDTHPHTDRHTVTY